MNNHLSLHIVLEKPPPNVHFGLQKGSGSKYETVQTQKAGLEDLHFNLVIALKARSEKYSEPVFAGPFVQGTPLNQFIYIDIGSYAGQADGWSRRLKIPLTGITWEMINEAQTDTKFVLETRVPGTGKDGGPNCATVKPFGGWKIKADLSLKYAEKATEEMDRLWNENGWDNNTMKEWLDN